MSTQPKYGKLSPEQQAIADELFGAMPISKPERPAMNNPQITETDCPMSNIDKQALRVAAEKATKGKRELWDSKELSPGLHAIPVAIPSQMNVLCHVLGSSNPMMDSYTGVSRFKNEAEFIAAANPETVLALLDELEAAEALNKHLELAIRKAEGCSEALRRKTEAAEKRITELEYALNRHYELPDVYDMAIKQFESLAKSE